MRWWCRRTHRLSSWTLVEFVWSDEVSTTVPQEVHILFCKRCVRIHTMEGAG